MNIDTELRSTCDISLKTWLSEKELVVYACVSRPTLLKARESGALPYINLMGKIVYERTAVDAWIRKEARRSGLKRK